ncbi:MAG: hypothetical protein HFJ42_02750, partial [Clostridia bacterium]|nr:hypothetical protein [Clostridia bacterium]
MAGAIDENGDVWIWGCSSIIDISSPINLSENMDTKFIDIATTQYSCAAIDQNGNIWTWGKNRDGLLGNGNTEENLIYKELTQITNDVIYKEIDGGATHIIAKDEEDYLWSWGDNYWGQLGQGDSNNYYKPTVISKKHKIKQFYVSSYQNIAIDVNGKELIWGQLYNYQAGDGSGDVKSAMTKIESEEKYQKASISKTHSLILTEDGRLYGAGYDDDYTSTTGPALGLKAFSAGSKTLMQITNPNSSYNVTFMDGENTISTQTIQEGQSATAPVLTKEGYTLSWDKDFSNITSDLIVNAIWTPNVYTITLNTNGGNINSGNIANYTYGAGATLPTDVIKVGHTFDGWYEDSSLTGNRVTSISTSATGNKTYYAKWTANTYTVTLNENGGTINSGSIANYTYGIGATLPTNVTKQGYVFRGWFENANCEGTAVTKITETDTGNKTYYAKWLVDTDGDGIPDIEDDDTQVPYKVEHYVQNTDLKTYTLKETVDKVEGTENKLTGNLGHEVTAVAKQYPGFRENQTAEGRVPSGIVVVDGS